jgi:hypothetical protein
VTREAKFGYGFLLAGVGVSYLLAVKLGPLEAVVAASICAVSGAVLLIAGHRQMDADSVRVLVIYRDKQVQIHNRGTTNLYLWGAAYGAARTPIAKEPAMIAPGAYYYLFADAMERQFQDSLNKNGEGTTPFHAFITTEDSAKYTIRGILLGKMTNKMLTIHTQILPPVKGWNNQTDERKRQLSVSEKP